MSRLRDYTYAIIGVVLIFWVGCSMMSCQLFQKTQKNTNTRDTVFVSKESEGTLKVDSGTRKTDLAYWREVYEYGQQSADKDTTIVRNIYQPTKVIREGGTLQTQDNYYNTESYWKWKSDSIASSQLSKQVETTVKGSVLGIGFWIGIAAAGLVLLLLFFMLMQMRGKLTQIITSSLTK